MEVVRNHREVEWERFDFEKRIIPPASLVLEHALVRITLAGQIIDKPDVENPLVVNEAKEPIKFKGLGQKEYEEHLLNAADRIQIATIRLLSPIHRKHASHWLSNLAYEISPYIYDSEFLKEAAKWAALHVNEYGITISPWMRHQSNSISAQE